MENKKTSLLHAEALICLALVGIIFGVYGQVAGFDFVNYDDPKYVTENAAVKAGLTWEGLEWAFTRGAWHPLTYISLMVDAELYGLNAGGYHLTNLLFHVMNSLAVFLVFRRMTGGLWRSALLAALFALHPLRVESVAWVTERKDVLSGFFWMLAIWAYADYVRKGGWKRYGLIMLFLAMGLMSKPVVVTLPFVLLLLDYWPLGRWQWERGWRSGLGLVWEKVPLFFLTLWASMMTVVFQKSEIVAQTEPLLSRMSTALVSYVLYIFKLFWPVNLAPYYPKTDAFQTWEVLGAGLLLGGISALVMVQWRRRPYLVVGWLWFLGTLVPVTKIVPFGQPWLLADRYTYIPHMGLLLAVVWGTWEAVAGWRYRKALLGGTVALVIGLLVLASWSQTRHWRNSVTLFEHALAVSEENWLAHANLGSALTEQGKLDEAVYHVREAIRIAPQNVRPHYNLGVALAKQGKLDEAMVHFRDAVRMKPNFSMAYYNLGWVAVRQKRLEEAVSLFQEAVRLNPTYLEARNNLGVTLFSLGKVPEAIEQYQEILKWEPNRREVHNNLGLALVKNGDLEKAEFHFREALRINSKDPKALTNLGFVLMEKGKIREARTCCEKAIRVDPNFAVAHYCLGLAHLKAGKREMALRELRVLEKIRPDLAERLKLAARRTSD